MINTAFQASKSYFKGCSNFFATGLSDQEKGHARICAILFLTVIVPIVLGVTYVAADCLKGRAAQIHVNKQASNANVKKKSGKPPSAVAAPIARKPSASVPKAAPSIKPAPKASSIQLSALAQRVDHFGAGIVPYHIDAKGEAYILLAQEGDGRAAGQWCDFGGNKDIVNGVPEMAIDNAAREGFEETRDLLGTQDEIRAKIAANDPIGLTQSSKRPYATYFLKVDDMNQVTNKKFQAKVFSQSERMEKVQVGWVKARDVFTAIKQRKMLEINGQPEALRGCFCITFANALKIPSERALLAQLLGNHNLI